MDQITKNSFDIKSSEIRNINKKQSVLQKIADLSDDISLQFDKNFNLIFINKKGLKLFGSSLEELIGRNVLELFPEEGGIFITNLKRCLNSEEPLVFEFEIMVGNEKRTFEVRLVSFRDFFSREKSIYGIFKDISEIKIAKKSIDKFSSRYRLLFEKNLAGIFRASLSGILLECNNAFAEILGYSSPKEIVGTPVFKFYKDIEDRKKLIDSLMEQGFLKNYEICLKKKDGSYVWVLENLSLIEEFGQNMIEGTLIDITERKIIEEHLRESINKLQKITDGIIETMVKTIEVKDPHTANHERRVGKIAKAIAKEMSLEEEKIEIIYQSSLVHDIGKIYVPFEILTKPGDLTEIEYKIIKLHSDMGYKILEKIDFPCQISNIVLQHHERLDGSGYPSGLKNDEICCEARILAVADVVEAMASHRPYRITPGLEYALKEIEKYSGKLFDQKVVKATLKLFKGGFSID